MFYSIISIILVFLSCGFRKLEGHRECRLKDNLLIFTDFRSINMENMTDTKDIIKGNMGIPNGLGVDWIANNIYWTDNEYKVSFF